MHTRLFIFLLLVLNGFGVQSQPCRCPALNRQQLDELVSNNDSAAIYTTLHTLRQGPDKNCLALAYDLEISHAMYRRQLAQALKLLSEQEALVAGGPCKEQLLVQYYLNYATYCKVSQDYEGLSKYAFLALAGAETVQDKRSELKAIAHIVHLFTRQNQEDNNWAYIQKAQRIITTMEEDYYTPVHYNWLAFEYERKFTLTERRPLLDSALVFATKAKALAIQYKNYAEVTSSFRVFESHAYNSQQFKLAIRYIDSAIFYSRLIRVPVNPSGLYFAKAWDYLDLRNFKEAERWQDTCIFYAEKYEGRTPATLNIYGEAAKLYQATGNLPKAIATLKLYQKIKDSVFTLERSRKINELEQKYNKAKDEKTIHELAQQRRIYLLLALSGLLAVVAIAFFLRQQSLKHKKHILETEQRLNRARMNPHFFFNTLATLQKFAITEQDGSAMANKLSRFSHIMRETLENTYREYVTIEQEMDFLNQYLDVQRIRLPQSFSYSITAGKDLVIDELLIPSMIIQPFVENSIEHGFAGVHYPGTIDIQFTAGNKELLVAIKDNGKGLPTTARYDNEHISRASQIIKDRIYLLNIKLKTRAGFSIDNNADGQGVVVQIRLPLLYKDQIHI